MSTKAQALAAGAKLPADRLNRKKPLTREVKVYMEPDLVDAVMEAEAQCQIAALQERPAEEQALLKSVYDEAVAAAEECVELMRFQSIGRKAYEDLVNEYPPTEEQLAEAVAEGAATPPYDGDVFPAALIAATCTSHELTVEDVLGWIDEWNALEVLELFQAALVVCTQTRRLELGND